MIAFSFILTWVIAKAVDRTVGFRAEEAYGKVGGEEMEQAYDFETAERLGALTSDKSLTSDAELVAEIGRLLKARDDSK